MPADRATVLALVAVVLGAGSFATIAAHVTVPTTVTGTAQLWDALLVVSVLATCVAVPRRVGGPGRALTLAMGAGSAYGCMSVLMQAAGEEFTSPVGGSGIGLTIARAHGGHLTATSPGAGQGATFTLQVPLTV